MSACPVTVPASLMPLTKMLGPPETPELKGGSMPPENAPTVPSVREKPPAISSCSLIWDAELPVSGPVTPRSVSVWCRHKTA